MENTSESISNDAVIEREPSDSTLLQNELDPFVDNSLFLEDIRVLLGNDEAVILEAEEDLVFEDDEGGVVAAGNAPLESGFKAYCHRCLKGISAEKYRKQVHHYKEYCIDQKMNPIDPESVLGYIDLLRVELDYLASTIWSAVVILCTWFTYAHNIRALDKCPKIKEQVKKWASRDDVKQATAFKPSEIEKHLNEAPNDKFHLVRKAVLVYAFHGLCRRSEIVGASIGFLGVKDNCIIATIERVKTVGRKEKQSFFIKNDLYVNTIKNYLALFPSDMLRDKEVRLFKKVLKQKGKNGKDDSYYVGKQAIGINTT